MSNKQITFNVPAHLNFSSAVRRFSNSIFKVIGFAEEWCNRLELVVDELFMNGVMYGSTLESQLHMIIEYNEVEVTMAVHDEGKGQKKITPDQLKAIVQKNGADQQVTNTSGRGLAVIAELWTDHFDIDHSPHGGLAIRFTKKIDSQPPPLLTTKTDADAFGTQNVQQASLNQGNNQAPIATPNLASNTIQNGIEISVQDGTGLALIEALATQVKQKVESLPSGSTLVLDFNQTDYINSTFIGYLASWYNELQTKGSKLIIKNVNQSIKDVLTLVGLNQIFSLDQ